MIGSRSHSQDYVLPSLKDSYSLSPNTAELVNAFNANPYNFDSVDERSDYNQPTRSHHQPPSTLSPNSYPVNIPVHYKNNKITEKPRLEEFGVNLEVNRNSELKKEILTNNDELIDSSFGEYVPVIE